MGLGVGVLMRTAYVADTSDESKHSCVLGVGKGSHTTRLFQTTGQGCARWGEGRSVLFLLGLAQSSEPHLAAFSKLTL